MTDNASLESRLLHLINHVFNQKGNKVVALSSTLKEDLDLDSLELMRLLMAVEDEFSLSVELDDVSLKIKTVGDLLHCVECEIAKGNVRSPAMPKDEQP